jgi:hypothetical protein
MGVDLVGMRITRRASARRLCPVRRDPLRTVFHFESWFPEKTQRRTSGICSPGGVGNLLGPQIPSTDMSAIRMPRFNHDLLNAES